MKPLEGAGAQPLPTLQYNRVSSSEFSIANAQDNAKAVEMDCCLFWNATF